MIEVGERYKTKSCGWLEITSYENATKVGIRFEATGYESFAWANRIRDGSVKDLMLPTIYGMGFIGGIKHKSIYGKRHSDAYVAWIGMLRRCYNEKERAKSPTYAECTVCDSWLNFQLFAEWFEENYIAGLHLDKDIKNKGNKVYGPDNCLFVTQSVNTLLTNREAKRGAFPVGVTAYRKRFIAQCCGLDIKRHVGVFDTPEEAHEAYKEAKNKQIIRAMDENKDIAKHLEQHLYKE